jgi:uncharacterized protein (TIGR03067 family)
MLPLAALVSLGFAPAPVPKPIKPDANKDDLKKLQGAWVRVHLTINGKPRQANCTITIRGDRLQFPVPSDAWLIHLDPSKKPKVFDYKGATPSVKDIDYRGVYRIEGDTLTICMRQGGAEKDRPHDFDANKQGLWLQVFKRKKP